MVKSPYRPKTTAASRKQAAESKRWRAAAAKASKRLKTGKGK